MTTFPSTTRQSMDPLHIGETMKAVWERPFPNALLWPISLLWKNIRPAFWKTLEWGKQTAVEGVRGATRTAMKSVLNAPVLPIPR